MKPPFTFGAFRLALASIAPASVSLVSIALVSIALASITVASITVASIALVAEARAADTDPQTLRVLCYNIHYGQGNDKVYDIARLAEVIKAAKPDLVALQEVDVGVRRSNRVHQVRRLAELTGLAARYGPTQHYEGGLFGNAVLTRLPILDVVIHPLPYTEATEKVVTYPRAAIAVTVQGPDGQPLRFISTHFQHNLPEDRVAEAGAINQLFAGENDDIPTILAGDMNAKPDSEPMSILHRRWTNAIDKAATPTSSGKTRIDYVLYRPAHRFRVVETKVIDERMASDHLPVFSILELQADKP
jgi:endonuclease/exonuclease/phosphatase family metal-dependent hydrolase